MVRTDRADCLERKIASSPQPIRILLLLVSVTAGALLLFYVHFPATRPRAFASETTVCSCLSVPTEFLPPLQSKSTVRRSQSNESDEYNNWFTHMQNPPHNSCKERQNGGLAPEARYVSYPENTPIDIHCKRCAYVTGSGHMAGSRNGKEIDEHDCVIRSNGAPTRGYEADVGRKTTIRTVDVNSLCEVGRDSLKSGRREKYFEESTEKDRFVLVYGSVGSVNKTVCLFNELKRLWPKTAFYTFTTAQYHNIRDIFTSRVAELGEEIWISNGFTTLLLLHEICDKIDVYGITDAEYCDREKRDAGKKFQYHYYDKIGYECDLFRAHSNRKTWAHRFLREKNVFGEWVKEWGNLYFHSPQWPNQDNRDSLKA